MKGIKQWLMLAIWGTEVVVGLVILGVSPKIIVGIALILSGIASFLHDCYKEALTELKREAP